MCNLYSITTNQAAIIALFRVINRAASDSIVSQLCVQLLGSTGVEARNSHRLLQSQLRCGVL
jgi:hypothetical protein